MIPSLAHCSKKRTSASPCPMPSIVMRLLESAFLGLGEPRQAVPAPFHPYYPGDEYAFKYTELDLDTANSLLDGFGLTERDADGMRLLPDGNPMDIELGVVPAVRQLARYRPIDRRRLG